MRRPCVWTCHRWRASACAARTSAPCVRILTASSVLSLACLFGGSWLVAHAVTSAHAALLTGPESRTRKRDTVRPLHLALLSATVAQPDTADRVALCLLFVLRTISHSIQRCVLGVPLRGELAGRPRRYYCLCRFVDGTREPYSQARHRTPVASCVACRPSQCFSFSELVQARLRRRLRCPRRSAASHSRSLEPLVVPWNLPRPPPDGVAYPRRAPTHHSSLSQTWTGDLQSSTLTRRRLISALTAWTAGTVHIRWSIQFRP